ncbi:protein of unknown function [Trichlorobacter ammonificans]|uniref:Uncharacterized protein n=1 Tax=Trichlorobacter ammonificans TaxID=2916410 RepID=A0ABN8HIC9_9BACT|nr:protein of unknown function [Trichlorobacter ammonificans]
MQAFRLASAWVDGLKAEEKGVPVGNNTGLRRKTYKGTGTTLLPARASKITVFYTTE